MNVAKMANEEKNTTFLKDLMFKVGEKIPSVVIFGLIFLYYLQMSHMG